MNLSESSHPWDTWPAYDVIYAPSFKSMHFVPRQNNEEQVVRMILHYLITPHYLKLQPNLSLHFDNLKIGSPNSSRWRIKASCILGLDCKFEKVADINKWNETNENIKILVQLLD